MEIIQDILRQNANAAIVVCGDFNNHLPYISGQLSKMDFAAALEPGVETHKLGNQLDQVFAKNI